MKFDRSGNLVNCYKITDGHRKLISNEQASEISELQKYDYEYLSSFSDHYDYEESFWEMKFALDSY